MSQLVLLTKDSWQEYEDVASTLAMYGYMDASGHFVSELKRILLSENFLEMKEQLTQLCNDREEFEEHVSHTLGKPKNKRSRNKNPNFSILIYS